MGKINILIVEGNLISENQSFKSGGIPTHTDSLVESIKYFNKNLILDVINLSSNKRFEKIKSKLSNYQGIIWGGSSLNIYNNTPEIINQIEFMKECQKKVKNILGICWGMQVAVTAAGGEVKKAKEPHIGIAKDIIINKCGISHPIYLKKNISFNSPAFNFDEVVTLPKNAICLASNKINKIESLYFEINKTKVWGLQYHPEITYEKMIRLIKFRKDRLINKRKAFKNENEINKRISLIQDEILKSDKEQRMLELKNWLNIISN